MVFFNCGECGESMRKTQVEKHYKFKCRNCRCLSCVDCGKEFWGDAYQKHTKCISEDEKYGGKDYKPKPNANKGERKQEEWTEQVQSAINKCKDPKLRMHLEKMNEYSNIPRKKAKFENFIKNSLRVPAHLATKLWDVISAESMANNVTANPDTDSSNKNCQTADDAEALEDQRCENGEKLNKRQRKEERQKQRTKKEKKDRVAVETTQQDQESREKVSGKKKRKRKHEEEEEMETIESENQDPMPKKKKKRHLDVEENGVTEQPNKKKQKAQKQRQDATLNESMQSQESDAEAEQSKKTKFQMENAILHVLKQADGQEVKLKKLKKKVLAEYFSCNPDGHLSENKISTKFDKKLAKNPKLKIHKDRVKLLN